MGQTTETSLFRCALPAAVALFAAGNAVAQTEPRTSPAAAATTVAAPSPTQLVDALNGVFGQHPGFRAVHAKGVVLEGQFVPAPTAAPLSKAEHLQKATTPVTVRFSNFAGVPDIPDNHELASPHGLAVKFNLPNGAHTDIVAHSFNGFPAASAGEFRQLLIALGASGPDAPKPTALDTYLGSHPAAKSFLTTPKPAPVSYGTLPYFGVDTFKFVNAQGDATYVRYQFIPLAGDQRLPDALAASAKPDYLIDEIGQRTKQGPVKFTLVAQIAGKDDNVDDPSTAWPDNRRKVELGTLEITHTVADSDAAQRKLLFMPNALIPGIEAGDSMLQPRSSAYPVSFGRRSQ